jgi:hypothetical protein
MNVKHLIIGLSVLVVAYFFYLEASTSPSVPAPAPPIVATASPAQISCGIPVQVDLSPDELPAWTCNNCRIVPLARYNIQARILHRDVYSTGREAQVSPMDFALGWGRMADPAVYGKVTIEQDHRWYMWHWSGIPPISTDEVNQSSANTHLIPGSPKVDLALSEMQVGDIVKMAGYLVQVEWPDGGKWRSSLTRNDTGDGACELMWVNEVGKVGQ